MTGKRAKQGRISLLVLAFIAAALFGFGATIPIGPVMPDEGRIVSIRQGGWRPDVSAEFVSTTGETARVPLPRRHDCKVGDTIRLERWKRTVGTGYRPADKPPCAAPFRN